MMDNMDLKMLFSKTLGYSIVVASALIKLPQLLKVLDSKSSAGLSFVGSFLELLAVSFTSSYALAKRFPFSALGETPFLQIESALICFFVLWYDDKKSKAATFVVLYVVIVFVLVSGITPVHVLWYLQASNLALVVTSKTVQARKNYTNQHTGQMSAITVTLLLLRGVARVFTSILETGDKVVITTFVAASLANLVLVFQILYYWRNTEAFLKKETNKKAQ